MSQDPTYSRESLEAVIDALGRIKADTRLQRQLRLFAFDVDQAIGFMQEHLDSENVADSYSHYVTME